MWSGSISVFPSACVWSRICWPHAASSSPIRPFETGQRNSAASLPGTSIAMRGRYQWQEAVALARRRPEWFRPRRARAEPTKCRGCEAADAQAAKGTKPCAQGHVTDRLRSFGRAKHAWRRAPFAQKLEQPGGKFTLAYPATRTDHEAVQVSPAGCWRHFSLALRSSSVISSVSGSNLVSPQQRRGGGNSEDRSETDLNPTDWRPRFWHLLMKGAATAGSLATLVSARIPSQTSCSDIGRQNSRCMLWNRPMVNASMKHRRPFLSVLFGSGKEYFSRSEVGPSQRPSEL